VIQKFEVLRTTYLHYRKKYVLIIQPCPEEGGKGYFVAERVYKMTVATTQPPGVFAVQNLYSGEHLPKFWTREIERVDN
jgi:hypothetical protein